MSMDQLAMLIEENSIFFIIMSSLSLVIFLGSVLAVPRIVCKMPADYFIQKRPRRMKLLVLIVRNCIGFVFVSAGVFMLVTPGQGVLTILAGLLIMSYPGKAKIERRILMVRSLRRALNWVRTKQGCAPMVFENSDRTDV